MGAADALIVYYRKQVVENLFCQPCKQTLINFLNSLNLGILVGTRCL